MPSESFFLKNSFYIADLRRKICFKIDIDEDDSKNYTMVIMIS